MAVKDILAFETSRHGQGISPVTVRLYAEGTFYHAYEWSAWLACRFINQFNAKRKKLNGYGTYAYVGFPLTSLEKFTPEGAVVIKNQDGSVVDICLPETTLDAGIPLGEHLKQLEEWKQSVPFVENNNGNKNSSAGSDLKNISVSGGPERITTILQNIITFSVEDNSPLQCMQFIVDLKKKLANAI